MTTYAALPAISTLVEMTASDGPLCGVRIDDVRGARLDLRLPPGAAPAPSAPGDQVTLRWSAGQRGRYAVRATVVGPADGSRLAVEVTGIPEIEQNRHYVRGGGGEQVRLHRPGSPGAAEFAGWIRDISERGVRAHFAEADVTDGDPLRLLIHLDEDTVELIGTVLKVTALPGAVPPQATRVEVVAVFDADEVQAQVIRRYVLRQQLLTRTRTAG